MIVPARNEARNIAACLRSVCDTAYRPSEVIVVDDRSSDATAEIAERPGVRPAVPYVLWVPSLCWILPPLVAAGGGARWALATTAVSLAIWIAAYRF